jgi:gamma-glutamylcysteine synthetase
MTRTVPRRNNLTAQASEATERAAAKLAKRGLVAPERPEIDVPTLPVALVDLDDASLLGLFTELVVWADYTSTQLAYAAIDERALTVTLEFHEATAMVRDHGSDKVTIARAQRDLDDDVQKLKQEQLDAYAVRKLAETLFNNLERDAALVSRELTRRTAGQAPTGRRADRYRP